MNYYCLDRFNHRLLPDQPAYKLVGGQFFLFDLLFTNQRFFAKFLQCGLRLPNLFGWCAGLF